MKLAVSGWPGGGSSTLSMLLSNELNYKYLNGSEVFRHLAKKFYINATGKSRIKADQILEPEFGPIYDKYIDLVLTSDKYTNYVVESDIAGFRVGKINGILSIFLITDLEARKDRLAVDSRHKDIPVLEERLESLRKIYHDLYKIDFTDLSQIKSKYHLVIDNTNMNIATELEVIYESLFRTGDMKPDIYEKLIKNTEKVEDKFWKIGKQGIMEELKNKDLTMTVEQMLDEIKSNFKSEISQSSKELQTLLDF